MPSWLTVLIGGVATALPIATPFIPPPFNIVATGVLGIATGIYHLYQESPSTVAPVQAVPVKK